MYSSDQPSILPPDASYDVIVVGAGIAGTATALLLARHAVGTVLLDDGPRPGSGTLATHALTRAGVLELSRLGLLDEIIAAGTPPVKRTTFRYGDESVNISVKPSHGVDAFYAPPRELLGARLLDAAIDAGVDVRHGTSVTDLNVRDGRVVGVHAARPDGSSVELRAPLVIGADGIGSTVARRVNAAFSRTGDHAHAVTYGYWSDLATDGYEWIFRPNASSGVIPTNDGRACVFVSASPERVGDGGVDLIGELIAVGAPDIAERLRTASPPRAARTWSGYPSYVRRGFGPGWALVGDAGYFKGPISAHGFTDALRDADLLARAVVDGLGDESSLDEALEHYQTIRDRLGIPLFDISDRIASQEWDDDEIAYLLLQLSSAMAAEVEMLAALEPETQP